MDYYDSKLIDEVLEMSIDRFKYNILCGNDIVSIISFWLLAIFQLNQCLRIWLCCYHLQYIWFYR